ncbi:MAG: hypothetical protein HYV07_17240 [Deltaproteobacteria bacterium]|nr:hypothetical protein [Deltaproteobacteria bacterium]
MIGPTGAAPEAFGGAPPFAGFEPTDFDAYQQRKWASKAFTLERRQVKDKLSKLARDLREALGPKLSGLELHSTDDAPSLQNGHKVDAQLAFFTVDAEARKKLGTVLGQTDLMSKSLFDVALQHRHACLVIRVAEAGLDVGLEVSAPAKADRKNFAAALSTDEGRTAVLTALGALGPGVDVGFDPELVDATRVDIAQLARWSDQLAGVQSFVARRRRDRSDAELKTSEIAAAVAADLDRFLPLFTCLAWREDNDRARLAETLREGAVRREQLDREAEAARKAEAERREHAEAERKAEVERIAEAERKAEAERRSRPPQRPFERRNEVRGPDPRSEVRAPESRGPDRRFDRRPDQRRTDGRGPAPDRREGPRDARLQNERKPRPEAPTKTTDAPVKSGPPGVGERVTILTGLFNGRVGQLAELDGKGRAKVMVGPISVTVEAKDLARA